jgi:cell division protein FtsB
VFEGRSRFWVAAAAVTAAALLLVLFVGRQVEIGRRHQAVVALESDAAAAAVEQDALRERLAAGDDLAQIEQEARQRLGLIMPGEEKIIFVQEPSP